MYNKVNPMYDAYDILSTKDGYISEMSRRQQGFLCGLIKKTKPNKILEIGVAEGGTTASVMKTLSLLGMKSEVFSVDLATKLYNNYNLDCGYLYKEWKEDIKGQSMHKFLLGKTVAAQMDNIGKDVDFCIIDTVHFLPGELLDFLAVYPYLKNGATVVLHDTNLDYLRAKNTNDTFNKSAYKATATKNLFSLITAEKYINMNSKMGVPNIAAFVVNEDTQKYIKDVFFALTLTWGYMPEEYLLAQYRECYAHNYDPDCLDVFDLAIAMNRVMVDNLPTHEW